MAGFRTFATGEVLTAANVNDFLMKQSVMVFADAAARTAALGAEVTEGMLTFNLATDQLEVFDGSAFVVAAPAPPAGVGSNVVQTVKTDVFTSTVQTFTTVTGLSVTITPTSESSLILVLYAVNTSMVTSGSSPGFFRLVRGSTPLFVGDADGNRLQSFGSVWRRDADFNSVNNQIAMSGSFLDSPASASAVTYAIQSRSGSSASTHAVNRGGADVNNPDNSRTASSITVIEVAA